MIDPLELMLERFERGFRESAETTGGLGRRVGVELKFPFVQADGQAVAPETVDALWQHLIQRGWRPDMDSPGGPTVGARKAGEHNDTVASCETGYCKTEFSLAHAGDISDVREGAVSLAVDLAPFFESGDTALLCYGIQPVSAPSASLLMQKMRASFWDKAFPSNNVVPPAEGDDVHLFTLNACSHVHVSIARDDAVKAVNVLNGFAGAQISLTANSGVAGDWIGDHRLKCMNEKFWDWWEPAKDRVGVPSEPFTNLEDYVGRIGNLKPVYAKREGSPVLLCYDHSNLLDYLRQRPAKGRTPDGNTVYLTPEEADIATHNSCYWYTARISRYYTVENRVFDQQPADSLLAPAALTLGLVENLDEAWEEISAYDWELLRETREAACRLGMNWTIGDLTAGDLAERMLEIATRGLKARDKGEEDYLDTLWDRLERERCPADDAADLIAARGITGLVEAYRLIHPDRVSRLHHAGA